MTQMMLDFSATSTMTTMVAPVAPASPVASVKVNGSLPLYDARQGELHHAGDLAQAVLARYDMVHRRRAARLRRERQAALERAAG